MRGQAASRGDEFVGLNGHHLGHSRWCRQSRISARESSSHCRITQYKMESVMWIGDGTSLRFETAYSALECRMRALRIPHDASES